MANTLRQTAEAALAANPQVRERLEAALPTAQYKAVGTALARAVAKKADSDVHKATWAIVNAFQAEAEEQEEINEDF